MGFKWCLEQGYIIKGVVSDGFKGLTKSLRSVPFQICEVHIQRAVMKKLTRKPPSGPSSKKSTAGAELLAKSFLNSVKTNLRQSPKTGKKSTKIF